jgi:Protein of unknown function (DUF2934)
MAATDQEAIRRRAYEISQEDGSGNPEEDWRRAEEELRSATAGAAKKPRAAAKKPAAGKPAAKKPA